MCVSEVQAAGECIQGCRFDSNLAQRGGEGEFWFSKSNSGKNQKVPKGGPFWSMYFGEGG